MISFGDFFYCFNPCFNGTMYKNYERIVKKSFNFFSFNPCFNGTMYKNRFVTCWLTPQNESFNPCFNGSMYKNNSSQILERIEIQVSILVLMDLCIKTVLTAVRTAISPTSFNPCFNGSMYKNKDGVSREHSFRKFQSLF